MNLRHGGFSLGDKIYYGSYNTTIRKITPLIIGVIFFMLFQRLFIFLKFF